MGIGSSAPCFIFTDCPNGTGYAFVAARQLRSQNYTVTVTNTVFRSAVISRAFQDLGRQYGKDIVGNFIEQQMPFVPADSTLVTIFAGANDVNVITAALGGGAGSGDRNAFIDQQVRNFGNDYTTLLSRHPRGCRVGPRHRVEPAEHRRDAVPRGIATAGAAGGAARLRAHDDHRHQLAAERRPSSI